MILQIAAQDDSRQIAVQDNARQIALLATLAGVARAGTARPE
jgi:hypothetical protein